MLCVWTRVAVSISYNDNHYTTATYPVKVNRIGTVYHCGSNKEFSSRGSVRAYNFDMKHQKKAEAHIACSRDWTCNLQMIVSLESWGTNAYNRYAMRPAGNNAGILNTCTRLGLTESEQANPVDSIKDVVRSSVKVPEFDKHLKRAGGHIGRNVEEITSLDEENSPKTLNDKNHQASSQNFRQLKHFTNYSPNIELWPF